MDRKKLFEEIKKNIAEVEKFDIDKMERKINSNINDAEVDKYMEVMKTSVQLNRVRRCS